MSALRSRQLEIHTCRRKPSSGEEWLMQEKLVYVQRRIALCPHRWMRSCWEFPLHILAWLIRSSIHVCLSPYHFLYSLLKYWYSFKTEIFLACKTLYDHTQNLWSGRNHGHVFSPGKKNKWKVPGKKNKNICSDIFRFDFNCVYYWFLSSFKIKLSISKDFN